MTTSKRNLKIAIQKSGRLTNETLDFLCKAGFCFETTSEKLFAPCRNFPLTLIFVRDDDIARYVQQSVVDIGIIGQNMLNEQKPRVKKLLNLRFGFCSLIVAVPKESKIQSFADLTGKTIATTYTNAASYFLTQNNIKATIVPLSGSVEIAPTLGIADAIIDLVATGSTLVFNDLRVLTTIFESEAVLIANSGCKKNKAVLFTQFLQRCKSVLSAQGYVSLSLFGRKENLEKIKKLMPSFQKENGLVMQTIIKEDFLWELLPRLQEVGVTDITVLPVTKRIEL